VSITKLFIDRHVVDSPATLSIQSRLKVPFEIVRDSQPVFDLVLSAQDPIQKGKEILFLTRNNGPFLKRCPGTQAYTCCDYRILHIGTFCLMDCTYCILQSYFHPPVLQYFVNHDDLTAELNQMFSEKKVYRIGTGEFTDSMIWETWVGLSRILVPAFAVQNHAVLELKTKTTAIKDLQSLHHNRKTIVAWSLNTNRIISQEERKTASLNARLKAAAKCASWGYPLAFHFDPMVIYPGCEPDYRHLVQQLFSHVAPGGIVWISLGSLRFMPSLKGIIQKRFPDSRIIYGEFITGLDGKMRYFKPLRIELYRKMAAWIRQVAPDVFIYFCMEDEEVWQAALGVVPSDYGGLPKMLDECAVRHCGLHGRG
jgi:spore photoproduct lyase